jgi:hypothetical protein
MIIVNDYNTLIEKYIDNNGNLPIFGIQQLELKLNKLHKSVNIEVWNIDNIIQIVEYDYGKAGYITHHNYNLKLFKRNSVINTILANG